jgi:hypothetical protein
VLMPILYRCFAMSQKCSDELMDEKIRNRNAGETALENSVDLVNCTVFDALMRAFRDAATGSSKQSTGYRKTAQRNKSCACFHSSFNCSVCVPNSLY